MNETMNMSGVPAATEPAGPEIPSPQRNTVFQEGFWADEAAAAALWADCLAGGKEGGRFLARMEATAKLFGYERAVLPWSLSNLAWFNGATAFFMGAPLSAVLELVGNHEALGGAVLDAVLKVRGVAGHEDRPVLDQRELLTRAFAEGGFESLPFDAWLEALMVAGWLAAKGEHLVTHRAYHQELTQQTDWMLTGQLVRSAAGVPDMGFAEPLARVIASDYRSESRLESVAVGRSVELSLAAARASGWGVCGFLLDGIRRGEELVRTEPSTVLAVLQELKEGLTSQEVIMAMLFDGAIGRASDEAGWRKLVEHWTPYKLRGAHKETNRPMALRVLKNAYDGMFWFGVMREVNRTGTTAAWMEQAHAKSVAETVAVFTGKR